MRLLIIVVAALLAISGMAWAAITSYGKISGSATVSQAISWDLIETGSDVNTALTNDTTYVLETTYQGETKWVKIKIINSADVAIPVNVLVSYNQSSDLNITKWDENKTAQISNPINVPNPSVYIWLKHQFSSSATPGIYYFDVDIVPA